MLDELRLAAEISGINIREFVSPWSRHVAIGRMRLHYLDWGRSGQPSILFLHGGGLNAHSWDLVCLALRDRFHCLALDQRGHGDSEWSPEADYSPDAYVRDIDRFYAAVGVDRTILVGQSLGAMNALVFASQFPARVAALVLVDYTPDIQSAGGQRVHRFVAETASSASLDELVERALAFNPLRDRRLLRQSLLHNFRELPDGTWMRKNDLRRHESLDDRLIETARRQWGIAPSITCPSLIVRGASSDVISDSSAEKLAKTLRHGTWVRVEAAGHNVQGDNPRGLVDVIVDFFDSGALSYGTC